LLDALLDAVANVLVQQPHAHRLQRRSGGVDLGQDVDAVLVLLDHPLDPTDRSLDPAQAIQQVLAVHRIADHRSSWVTPFRSVYPGGVSGPVGGLTAGGALTGSGTIGDAVGSNGLG